MFVYGVRQSVVREVGKKRGRVATHYAFVPSLLSEVLCLPSSKGELCDSMCGSWVVSCHGTWDWSEGH